MLILGAGATLTFRHLYHLLAPSRPASDGPCIIEGWLGDEELRTALEESRRHPFPVLLVVGGPIEKDSAYASYGTYARLATSRLLRFGADEKTLQTLDVPGVARDRTYNEARHARTWLEEHGYPVSRINLISIGAHCRRSRLLYTKAFGPQTEVGINVVPDTEYDGDHWWRTSAGFRTVISEAIAYTYARFFFHEDRP